MRLLITRHGQTKGNVDQILADHKDPLTKVGVEQATLLAKRLKKEPISTIYASPLIRAKKTAEIIAKFHKKSEFILVHDLREIDLGDFENKRFDSVDWTKLPKNVETRRQLFKRTEKVLKMAFADHPNETILFVSHNATNKALIRVLRGVDPSDITPIPQNNANLTVFEVTKDGNKEIVLNSVKHLISINGLQKN